MTVEIETFPVKHNHFGDQYIKSLKIYILKKQNYFQQSLKTNVEIIQTNLRTYQIKSKQLKKIPQSRDCINKGLLIEYRVVYGTRVLYD